MDLRRLALVPALLLPATALTAATASPGHAAPRARTAVTVTKTTLDFSTTVGPAGSREHCNVEGDLYVPSTATAATPAPAILTTNGFGGSKDSTGDSASNASYAQLFASLGYVTLSYSGLGFGDSECQIELDSPAYDGEAASQLVSFLGGEPGIAYTSYTAGTLGTAGTYGPAYTAVPPVIHDATDHDGVAQTYDPRVGMIGGSYGGEVQLAAASIDPRIDTIVPQITWNDLAYSLAPNNQGGPDVTQSEASPGVTKQEWVDLFSALGAAQPVVSSGGAQPTGSTCPGFDSQACTAIVELNTLGYPTQATMDFAHTASAGQYLSSIKIPTFLSQGEDDTLFTLREAATTFEALEAQHVPVKMLWQNWGHSGGPVAGEACATSATATDPTTGCFDDVRYAAWFDKYLRGDASADTGPAFEYYASWLPRTGTGPDSSQYLGAPDFPVGTGQTFELSGGSPTGPGVLTDDPTAVTSGTEAFAVTPVQSTSFTEISDQDQTTPVTDAPGSFAAWETAPLAADAIQVGAPTLTVSITAPSFVAQSQPADQLVLFAKLYDVAPDGTITLPNRVIAPVRVTDVSKPVTITLPDAAHLYPAGDRLELVLSASDSAYKANDTSAPVAIAAGTSQTLTIPFTTAATFGGGLLPEASTPVVLLGVGLVAATAVVLGRRRRVSAGR